MTLQGCRWLWIGAPLARARWNSNARLWQSLQWYFWAQKVRLSDLEEHSRRFNHRDFPWAYQILMAAAQHVKLVRLNFHVSKSITPVPFPFASYLRFPKEFDWITWSKKYRWKKDLSKHIIRYSTSAAHEKITRFNLLNKHVYVDISRESTPGY